MPKLNFWLSKKGISRPLNIAVRGNACKVVLAVAIFLFFFHVSSVFANNAAVTNASLVGQSSGSDTINVQFDISWANSWRDATNYDAVWVFIKYSTDSGATWSHATLKTSGTNPSGFSRGSGTLLDISVPTDKMGAFLYRSSTGSGTVTTTSVQLVWDYGINGVSDANASGASTLVKVFAIEMVYVPLGSYSLGDGNQAGALAPSTAGFMAASGSNCRDPIPVGSESAMIFPGASTTCGGLYYTTDSGSDDNATGAAFTIPADYPKGYKAFYMMKYELSQDQYRDFLNTLTQAQQASRVVSDITNENDVNTYVMIAEGQATPVARQTIKAGANPANGMPYTFSCDLDDNNTGNQSSDGQWIAMNYLKWADLAAYAAWAGLRPMTELEFEKAARGPIAPTNLEYAWGTVSATQAANITNGGQNSEYSSTASVNLVYGNQANVQGPLRAGAIATASTSSRQLAGQAYYGALDMSGNLRELIVTAGNASGRSFIGSHGNGTLSSSGNATNGDWPGFTNGEVSGALGSGAKGGDWTNLATFCRISDRQRAGDSTTIAGVRSNLSGGRCVRTA
jgi:formylglycine-generating enzyme required for sulfatase activity